MGHSSSCPLCGYEFEDLAHVLRDYPSTKDVWSLVLPQHLKQRFFSTFFSNWLLLDQMRLIAWRMWKNRNLFIFQNISWTATEVIKVSSYWAHQYESNVCDSRRNDPISNSVNNSVDTWIILSTDGAVDRSSGYAATGGWSEVKMEIR